MATRVLLTVDTELTWRHFTPGADWRDNFARSYEAAGVGIPYQLRMLRRHGLKACFFVDPMPALLYGIEPIARMVEPILAAGQEVQLHLHSFWSDLADAIDGEPRFELTQFDVDDQYELIAAGRDLLVQAGARPPTAFRSGSYAANSDTLEALGRLGISYDSSHNGADHPWPSALPLDPALLDPVECGGITEVPVTQIRRRDGGLRPFQLCALSRDEMTKALQHATVNCHELVTIVSHSFELASRDGRRANSLVRGRFDWLCAFLARHADMMPTIGFADVSQGASREGAEPLPAHSLRTARRMVEQAWGNARYERPALTATLLAAPPLVAMEEIIAYAGF